jgi:hypothetical protein
MTALKSTFADIQVDPNEVIKRINTPQLLIGQVYTYTPFHVEDENFASLNFVHKGALKIWILWVNLYPVSKCILLIYTCIPVSLS